jgi:hypothetical protein
VPGNLRSRGAAALSATIDALHFDLYFRTKALSVTGNAFVVICALTPVFHIISAWSALL